MKQTDFGDIKTVLILKRYVCSWSFNYISWKNLNKKYLIVKYEDLIIQPKTLQS